MSQDSRLQQRVGALGWNLGATEVRAGIEPNTDPADAVRETSGGPMAGTVLIKIKGITAVADAAVVQPPVRTRCGDDDVAATAAECLAWAGVMPANTVKVEIEDGWITLTGQVEWNYQRDLAERSVRWISGVVGVSNRTRLKPPVDGSDIGEELRDALRQSWFCDPAGILVATDAGTVRLSGTVQSSLHRRVADELAWGIRGVTAVENSIVVLGDRPGDPVRRERFAEGCGSAA